MKLKMTVEGMSCQHCVNHVKEALLEIEGVSEVNIKLEDGLVTFEADEAVKINRLKHAVEEAGYVMVSVIEV